MRKNEESMSYNVLNVNPTQINAMHDASGAIQLLYGTTDLSGYSDELLVELSTGNSTKVRVPDFTYGVVGYDVYVFEVDASGGLTGPWTRTGGGAESGTLQYSDAPAAPVDVDIVVLAVPNGNSAPTPASKSSAQQNGAGVARVKIRREGYLPTTSRRGQ